jgi:hypothetical protein
VDRLLASPHYGERWGRHWLDVVRYADTTANDANAIMRYAWRYRDYVVRALNQDKPYDQFLIEQLAGDLLPAPADPGVWADQVIATGYLMIGPKALAETDKEQSRMDIVDDQIDVTGRGFLGLTLGCARCHDHKFDPIPTVDYYALAGIFRSTEVFRDENRNATMWQEWELEAPGRPDLMVMAPKDLPGRELRVHLRGNRNTLGPPIPRRFPQILARDNNPPLTTTQSGRLELARWIASSQNPLTARVMVNRIWQHHFGTGLVASSDNFGFQGERPSHLELLDWLSARFIDSGWSLKSMHRMIMLSGAYQLSSAPHPDAQQIDPDDRLLWRYPIRRLEAEAARDAMLAVGGKLNAHIGGNDTIEVIYAAGENIDAKRGFVVNRVNTGHAVYDMPRRTIYLPVIRNALPDVLALFDSADPNSVSSKRNDTTVPSQALFMMNSPFVRKQALDLAQSVLADVEIDAKAARLVYRRVYQRNASNEDIAAAVEYVTKYSGRVKSSGKSETEAHLAAWQSFCQVLLCSNEFLYLE